MIEQLVGMQAQNHHDPYYALFSRIDWFRPEELSNLVESREALRIPLLRSTIHLVTARDALTIAADPRIGAGPHLRFDLLRQRRRWR